MEAVDGEEELPSVIGGYTVGTQLGQGAYSTVYLGVKDNEEAALKVMAAEGTDWDKEVAALKRLMEESALKAGGDGAPLILGMKELIDLRSEYKKVWTCIICYSNPYSFPSPKVCLIMERMQGQEMQKMIPKGGIPESQARDLFRQIVLALLYCHSQMVIHRGWPFLIAIFAILTRNGHQARQHFCGPEWGHKIIRFWCGSSDQTWLLQQEIDWDTYLHCP